MQVLKAVRHPLRVVSAPLNRLNAILACFPCTQQVRNPLFLVDCHPSCVTNSHGQPVVLDQGAQVPWKQAIFLQLCGFRCFEEVQALFR